MVIFRSNFSVFLSFQAQLTHLNASNLLNYDPSNRFLPIASQNWCSGVSKMATYIYIYIYISCRFIRSKIGTRIVNLSSTYRISFTNCVTILFFYRRGGSNG